VERCQAHPVTTPTANTDPTANIDPQTPDTLGSHLLGARPLGRLRLSRQRNTGAANGTDASPLARELAQALRGEVRFDTTSRAVFAADASNYRHVPIGVVRPRDVDDVLATIEVCRRHDAPVVARGGGTSIAGNSINAAVVLDFRRHMNQVLDIDPATRRARVQPGLVLDELQRQARPHGLLFGPDPSTHSRCSLGGMIGNNSCGSHSVAWGKTVDNITALDVVTYRGTRLRTGPTSEAELDRLSAGTGEQARIYRELRAVRDRYGEAVRTGFPDLTRRVSGYNLDQLLPEAGFDLSRALVGSEGTCATLLEATVNLVEAPAARALTVLGFPDPFVAADHVLPLLELQPLALEGIDAGLVAALRVANPHETVTRLLPEGGGWLYVETGGSGAKEAEAAAGRVADVGRGLGATALVVNDPATMSALWRIREDGAGILTRLSDGGEAWPGWEDTAVPPARLGGYLREFQALLDDHHLRGGYYGHFGEGCIHIRIDFDLITDAGVARFRRFMEEAADLVAAHGGSLSGEHGDGQSRAELLPRMFPAEVIEGFGAFKAAWDPDGLMNPQVMVKPRPIDADLRLHTAPVAIELTTKLAFHRDRDGFAGALRRCVGVGRCLSATGGVMCPSYRATAEEQHSTRGRARLLYEMANGKLVDSGWRSPEVRDALDLCLSCKGCKTDCPVGVDMATYKAEFLSHHYRGRLRPRSHYSLGWLPVSLRVGALAPKVVNWLFANPLGSRLVKAAGGIASERDLPPIAVTPFTRWWASRRRPAEHAGSAANGERRVLLWPDTFSNFFDPQVAQAAVAALEHLGYQVEVPGQAVCCGLPWMSTGQLGIARRVLRRSLRVLRPWLDAGVPIVGLEPSCTAMLRADVLELLGDDPDASRLANAVRSFAELLESHPGGLPEPIRSGTAMAQVHCHQHAEWGYDADRAILKSLGFDARVLDSGCCGLAGNFGFEAGHYEVSQACAERVLLPAVRQADDGTEVLADGFSCRTQVRQGAQVEPLHLAQLAARAWDLQIAP
jgi:FAD/FMN-containing dehydrogenase/Fe-S oxidoreductase